MEFKLLSILKASLNRNAKKNCKSFKKYDIVLISQKGANNLPLKFLIIIASPTRESQPGLSCQSRCGWKKCLVFLLAGWSLLDFPRTSMIT